MNREFLLRQFQRLVSCANYPKVSEEMTAGMVRAVVNEILSVLDECCASEAHAEATINDWLYANSFFPTPTELRRLALSLHIKFASPPPACPECNGSGWKEVQIRARYDTYDAAVPCDCRGGNAPAAVQKPRPMPVIILNEVIDGPGPELVEPPPEPRKWRITEADLAKPREVSSEEKITDADFERFKQKD